MTNHKYILTINNNNNMADPRKRLTELPTAASTTGLYTLGVNAQNEGVKIPIGDIVNTFYQKVNTEISKLETYRAELAKLKTSIDELLSSDASAVLERYSDVLNFLESVKDDTAFQDHIDDNVFIQCRSVSGESDWPYLMRPHRYAAAHGNVGAVDGVVLYTGGRFMLIAPDMVTLKFSDGDLSERPADIRDYYAASMDFDGRGNTAKLLENTAAQGTDNAAGYCAAYSHGHQAAGTWWLPSLGEMLAIGAAEEKINCAMRIIGGTELGYPDGVYHTSTTSNADGHWGVNASQWPNLHAWHSAATQALVRPVSAFGLSAVQA